MHRNKHMRQRRQRERKAAQSNTVSDRRKHPLQRRLLDETIWKFGRRILDSHRSPFHRAEPATSLNCSISSLPSSYLLHYALCITVQYVICINGDDLLSVVFLLLHSLRSSFADFITFDSSGGLRLRFLRCFLRPLRSVRFLVCLAL